MAVPAPFCNVTVFAPAPSPFSPSGFRFLSPNATLADVIAAFNNNFSPQSQQDEFNRQLAYDLNPSKNVKVVSGQQSSGAGSKKPSQNQIPKLVDDKIGKIRFTQLSIVRQKIKVENPKDKSQWVVDDRVKALVMQDKSGARWTWQDPNAGKGVMAGNEERINGDGDAMPAATPDVNK